MGANNKRPVPGTYLGSGRFGFVFEECKSNSSSGSIVKTALKIMVEDNCHTTEDSINDGNTNSNITAGYNRVLEKRERRKMALSEYFTMVGKHHPNIVKQLKYIETTYRRGEIQAFLRDVRSDQRVAMFIWQGNKEDPIDTIVIRMQLCGHNLRQWIDYNLERKLTSFDEVSHFQVEIVNGLVQGLSYLHKHKIMHRDLKPENVMFSYSSSQLGDGVKYFELPIKIGDFGLCRKLHGNDSIGNSSSGLTANVGTPIYQAPELVLGTYSFEADIFSLGLIIWEVVQLIRSTERNTLFHRLVHQYETDLVVDHPQILNSKEVIVGLTRKDVVSRIREFDTVISKLNYNSNVDNCTDYVAGDEELLVPLELEILESTAITWTSSKNSITVIVSTLTIFTFALGALVVAMIIRHFSGNGTNIIDRNGTRPPNTVMRILNNNIAVASNVEQLLSALKNEDVDTVQLTDRIFEIDFPIVVRSDTKLVGNGSSRTVIRSHFDCSKCDNKHIPFLEVRHNCEITGLEISSLHDNYSTIYITGHRNKLRDMLLHNVKLLIPTNDNFMSNLTVANVTNGFGVDVYGNRNKLEIVRFRNFFKLSEACGVFRGSHNHLNTVTYNQIQGSGVFLVTGRKGNKLTNVGYEYDNAKLTANIHKMSVLAGRDHEITNLTCTSKNEMDEDGSCDLLLQVSPDSQNVTIRNGTFNTVSLDGFGNNLVDIRINQFLAISGSNHRIENCTSNHWLNRSSNYTIVGGNCFEIEAHC